MAEGGTPSEAAAAAAALWLGASEAGSHSLGTSEPAPLPAPPDAAARRALAWALKDACYAAWQADAPRAARAAEGLRQLARQGPAGAPEADEIAGLAAWTAGIADVVQGRVAEAVPRFAAATDALRRAGLPDAAAQAQVPCIMALSMLGRHDEAADVARRTGRELRAHGNLAGAARVLQNLGSLLLFRDDYAEAAVHFREAAVLFARLRDHGHSVLADVGLADTLTASGDFDEAERIYARARMRAAAHGLAPQQALVDESAALLALARGRYRQALAGLESARRGYEALALPNPLAVAEKALGEAYLELRLLPEAQALLEAAEARFGALGLAVEQAWALAQLGRAQALQPHAGDPEAAWARAAALFVAQGNAVGQATVALMRAEKALAQHDADAAAALAREIRAQFGEAGRTDGAARAALVHAQALLAQARRPDDALAPAAAPPTQPALEAADRLQGQPALEAADTLQGQAALDAAETTFRRELAFARERAQAPLVAQALAGCGAVAQARGDAAQARALYDAAIGVLEDLRRTLPADDLRSAFGAEHLQPYRARLALELAAQPVQPAAVLQQLDRFRARALDERIAEAALEGDAADAAAALAPLRERVQWLSRRLQRLHEDGDDSPAFAAELARAEHELLEQARRQRLAAAPAAIEAATSHPSDADPGAPDRPTLDVDALVAACAAAPDRGDAVVAYGVADDVLFACVARADGVRLVHPLARWPEVQQALEAARFQLDALRHGTAPVARHLPVLAARAQARLAQLTALIWAPLLPALQAARRVVVVPHGALAALPFHALDAEPGRTLAVAPSARAAARALAHAARPARRVVALGESSRLAHAAQEAEAVAACHAQGRAFTGAAATLATLQAHAAEADVLHLACHAQFRSDNPRFSALHLADGLLTVDAAERLPLAGATVVLSACETAAAQVGQGDEGLGLVRAFLVAGAARVVASLWPVDDAMTAELMLDFHRRLAQGQPAAPALHAAREAARAHHPHPAQWSAFTVYGAGT